MTKQIQGMDISYDDACAYVCMFVEEKISEYNLDAEVIDVQLHGSRLRGQARVDSDLDAVVEYTGSEREDTMFNFLNDDDDERCMIDEVLVDINPIRKEESGTMNRYMSRSDEYDRVMLSK